MDFKQHVLIFFCIVLYSCSKDSEQQVGGNPIIPPAATAVITHEALDAAIFVTEAIDTLFTGNPFGARELEAQGNFRAIFSSANRSQVQQAGHITVIRNFTSIDGLKGTPLFIDVMVKRENGFNTAGNNFEYMRIPFDPSVDYVEHPNGMLPEITNTTLRGLGTNIMSVNCVNCHRTNSDFVFYN